MSLSHVTTAFLNLGVVMNVVRILASLALCVSSSVAMGWDGYDLETGTFVEIERGNLVREGREIEVHEYGEGYKQFQVEAINETGSSVELEVMDLETGELRTFEMDQD